MLEFSGNTIELNTIKMQSAFWFKKKINKVAACLTQVKSYRFALFFKEQTLKCVSIKSCRKKGNH